MAHKNKTPARGFPRRRFILLVARFIVLLRGHSDQTRERSNSLGNMEFHSRRSHSSGCMCWEYAVLHQLFCRMDLQCDTNLLFPVGL